MPEQTDIRTLVSFETDQRGVTGARAALKSVTDDQKKFTESFKRGEIDAKKLNEELTKLQKQEKGLEKAIDKATGEFTEQKKAMQAAAKEAAALAKEQERLAKIEARKPKAGSSEALRQVGRDIRGLPSLRVPGIGIGTDTFGRAAEVLGRVGVSMKDLAIGAGVATVALGLVAVAFHLAASAAKEQAQVLNSVIEANRKVGQDVAQGLSTEAAEERIAELKRLTAEEKKVLDENTANRERALNDLSQATNIGRDSLGWADNLAGLIPQMGTLNTQIDTSKSAIEGYETEINSLEDAMKDGTLAANDAAEAEAKLAQERIASILSEAAQAGELATLKERVKDLTQEQIDGELKALHLRETGLKAEIAALEASGDASEEVTKKLAQLKDQLGLLGEESDILKRARPTARSEAAEKAAQEAEKAAEKAANDRARAQEKADNDASRAQEKAIKDRQQAAEKAADELRKLEEDLNKLREETQEDIEEQERDHQRAMQDIVRDFGDQRVDNLEEQNFLALDKLNTEEARANRDQVIDNQRTNEDITRNANKEQQRLLEQIKTASQRRLQLEASALTQSQNNVQAWATGLVRITNQMAQQFQRRLDSQLSGDSQFREQSTYRTQPRSR